MARGSSESQSRRPRLSRTSSVESFLSNCSIGVSEASFGDHSQNYIGLFGNTIHIPPEKPLAERLLRWLDFPSTSATHAEFSHDRHHDLTWWFIYGAAFHSWMNTPRSILTLYGSTDTDRSVLAAAAIERMRTLDRLCLYFYFDPTRRAVLSTKACILELIRQTIIHRPDIAHIYERLYRTYAYGQFWPPVGELVNELIRALRATGEVYLVFDAVHRCSDPWKLQQAVADIRARSGDDVHIMLTRLDMALHAANRFSNEAFAVKVDAFSIDKYLSLFVRKELKKLGIADNTELHWRIEATCITCANGS